jgi:hypothetical protein
MISSTLSKKVPPKKEKACGLIWSIGILGSHYQKNVSVKSA